MLLLRLVASSFVYVVICVLVCVLVLRLYCCCVYIVCVGVCVFRLFRRVLFCWFVGAVFRVGGIVCVIVVCVLFVCVGVCVWCVVTCVGVLWVGLCVVSFRFRLVSLRCVLMLCLLVWWCCCVAFLLVRFGVVGVGVVLLCLWWIWACL